ncbi:MAG: phosphotransferase [Alcaligenaceae bacterium]|nr:phosphotransferase [Alcaligenaceae bacterium]
MSSNASSDFRLNALQQWLASIANAHQIKPESLRKASSDASFRRYFRVDTHNAPLIIMDAPPEQENCTPFISISEKLAAAGLNVPRILEKDLANGWLLLSDLGNDNYYQRIVKGLEDTALQSLYRDALHALVQMQQANAEDLPVYDAPRLRQELELFPEWYVSQHCQTTLSDNEKDALEKVFSLLVAHNAKQPRVFVHRDYHSPNLMVCDQEIYGRNPGIIDFQDALLGPISYDLVSLVMDARTTWEEPQQLDWAIRYWQMAKEARLPVPNNFADFHIDYEYMGLQRNLRILGVFARLSIRDGKNHYLQHIPRVNAYVRQVASRYLVFKPLLRLLDRLDNIEHKVGYTF